MSQRPSDVGDCMDGIVTMVWGANAWPDVGNVGTRRVYWARQLCQDSVPTVHTPATMLLQLSSVFVAFSVALVPFASASTSASSGSEVACTSYALNGAALANVKLNATTYYPANANITLSSPLGPLVVDDLPAFCRLELVITTNATAGSSAKAEVWLPDAWNGRALTVGNGGFAGGGKHIPCW